MSVSGLSYKKDGRFVSFSEAISVQQEWKHNDGFLHNGFLGKQPTNNRLIEAQVMHRFLEIIPLIHSLTQMTFRRILFPLVKILD